MLQIDFSKLDEAPINEKDVISEFEWLFDDERCICGPKRMVVGFIAEESVLLQWNFDQPYLCISPTGRSYYPDTFFNTIQERVDMMNRDSFEYGSGIVAKAVRDEKRDLNHLVRFYHYDVEENNGAIVEA